MPWTYPLGEYHRDELRAVSGKSLEEITLEALRRGELTPDDVRIRAETLRAQAEIAERAGYPQVAQNLRRAAELVAVPNDELLAIYEALRPGRSTYEQLMALAQRLRDVYGASETAALVAEAAEAYRGRGALRE
ncbi:MAG: hypothetical protein Kow0047_33680 [Anaerolineae bacterium]